MNTKIALESVLQKQPWLRKSYRVALIVPDNGIPFIEYNQINSFTSKAKPKKTIQLTDLLFADRSYEKTEKFAFSIYAIDKTITFLAQDENTMAEWLTRIRENHFNLFPDFKRYEAVFEAKLLNRDLAKTMNIHGPYRLALSKDSLDMIPILTSTAIESMNAQQLCNNNNTNDNKQLNSNLKNNEKEANNQSSNEGGGTIEAKINNNDSKTRMEQQERDHLQAQHQQLFLNRRRHQQRFHKRHPLLGLKTIELMLRSIRRCGHTDCQFYIEPGRHSQIGQGNLWMTLSKKSTVRLLHELLVNAMKASACLEDNNYTHMKGPRSRSGSSNDNALKLQQSRSTSQLSLSNELKVQPTPAHSSSLTTTSKDDFDENDGYLPMA